MYPHMSIYLSFCLSIFLSIYLSVYLSFCVSISISLSICLSIYLSIYQSLCNVYIRINISTNLSGVEDVPAEDQLVVPRPPLLHPYIHLRRGAQVHPQTQPRWLGGEGDLLLDISVDTLFWSKIVVMRRHSRIHL